jgi:SAM-dependent methyltransferase
MGSRLADIIRPGGARLTHKVMLNAVPWMRDLGARTILEVGCGSGIVLKELVLHGFTASGTEAEQEHLAELGGMSVYPYSVDELSRFGDNDFDLVVSVDLLDSLDPVPAPGTLGEKGFGEARPRAGRVLEESFRICRLGVVAVLGGFPARGWTREDTAALARWLSPEEVTERRAWTRIVKRKGGA